MTEFHNYDNPCILAALHPARSFADASARTSENSGSNALVNNSAYIRRVKECEKRIDFEEKNLLMFSCGSSSTLIKTNNAKVFNYTSSFFSFN